MRHPFLAALVMGSATALLMASGGVFSSTGAALLPQAAAAAQACDTSCDPAWMDAHLRLNQLQLLGTDSSYKLRPESGVLAIIRMGGRADAEAVDFAQPALTAQLDADVRALSFDLVHDPKGGVFRNPAIAGMGMALLPDGYDKAMKQPGFKVMRVPDVDYRSSCLTLTDCLGQVAAWSRAHPRHLPILISLRPMDEKTPMPGAATPPAIDAAALQALETEVHAVFGEQEIVTPALVRGKHAGLREAVQAEGWPLLGTVRGKVMFLLAGKHAASYHGDLMFAVNAGGDSVVQAVNDPLQGRARIDQALQQNQMVITLADDDTREARRGDGHRRDAAFASGAQIVLTDFITADPAIGPYRVNLQDQPQARCGAVLGSEKCVRLRETPVLALSLR